MADRKLAHLAGRACGAAILAIGGQGRESAGFSPKCADADRQLKMTRGHWRKIACALANLKA